MNPLLVERLFPDFAAIKPRHVLPALRRVLTANRKQLQCSLAAQHTTWDSLMVPLAQMDQAVHQVFSPVCHITSVNHSAAWQKVYEQGIALLSAYGTEMSHHQVLYARVKQLQMSMDFKRYSQARQTVVKHMVRDFELAGVHLSSAKKAKVKQYEAQLSQLSAQFSSHVLAATNAWHFDVADAAELSGLPETALHTARQTARAAGKSGYRLTLQMPCYCAVMEYAESRELRARLYRAKVSLASAQGNKHWNNEPVVAKIADIRYRLAKQLGFSCYSEWALQTRMAKDTKTVLDFTERLARRATPKAKREVKALTAFAKTHCQIDGLMPWDMAYVAQCYRQHHFSISQEQMRPYFAEPTVLAGLFALLKRLYGIQIKAKRVVSRCHPTVKVFQVSDRRGDAVGYIMLDLYARRDKRGGAWMDECQQRFRDFSGDLHLPVAHVVANFNPPVGRKPAQLTHDDLLTLFHEMGHALHHVLTHIEEAAVSGINGVPWDAVECPSQLMENWCWEYSVLRTLGRHQKTGRVFPKGLFNQLVESRQMLSGLHVLRQCDLGWFDMLLHSQQQRVTQRTVAATLATVRARTALIPVVDYNRFHCAFSHIFAGGYAAGYYSYLWAELLSLDAFEEFKQKGIMNAAVGRRFRDTVLAGGGSEPFMVLYKRFRGRAPRIGALLAHYGLNQGKK